MVYTKKLFQMPKSSSMVYTTKTIFRFHGVLTKTIFSFHGVHHEIQNPLPWCTPRKCQNPLSWCTLQKTFLAFIVYTIKFKICFCGVNNVSLHKGIQKSSSMVYTMKTIFSFNGVHHKMQNLLLWCTPQKSFLAFMVFTTKPFLASKVHTTKF